MYHLYPCRSAEEELLWLKADTVAITVAIWAPSAAFFMDEREWNVVFGIACFVTFANYWLVSGQFDRPPLVGSTRSSGAEALDKGTQQALVGGEHDAGEDRRYIVGR